MTDVLHDRAAIPGVSLRRECAPVRHELRHAGGWDPCVLDEGLEGTFAPVHLREGIWHVSPSRFAERVAEGTARRRQTVGTLYLAPWTGEGFRPDPS